MYSTTKIKIVVIAICVILLGLTIARIYISNMFTDQGIDLGKLQKRIDAIKKENMVLREQLYSAAAYTTISTEAASMGFVPAKDFIYLK